MATILAAGGVATPTALEAMLHGHVKAQLALDHDTAKDQGRSVPAHAALASRRRARLY